MHARSVRRQHQPSPRHLWHGWRQHPGALHMTETAESDGSNGAVPFDLAPQSEAVKGTGDQPRAPLSADLATDSATEFARLQGAGLRQSAQSANTDLRQKAHDLIEAYSSASFVRPTRSPIEADTEVAHFLAERFGLMPIAEIIAECRAKYGPGRTPGRSAAHRFWLAANNVKVILASAGSNPISRNGA
eukprot:gene24029-25674_t